MNGENRLYSREELRLALADWLLTHEKKHICSKGNVLGERFIAGFDFEDDGMELFHTMVDSDNNITLIFSGKFLLSEKESVCGRAESFIFHKHVAAPYDADGTVTDYVTLGYCW